MDINQNSKKQVTLGSILSYFGMFIQIFMSIITTPFIVRHIGDASYGVYKIIASFVAYLTVLNFGFGTAGIRYLSEYRITNQKDKEQQLLGFIHVMNIIAACVILAIGYCIYYTMPMIFGNSMSNSEIILARQLFIILIINIIVSVFTDKYSGVINAYEHFVFIKFIDVFRSVLKIILIFLILSVSSNAIFLTIIDLCLNIVIWISEKCYCGKYLDVKMNSFSLNIQLFHEYKEFLLYASGIFVSMIINQLLWNVDSVIIGMRLGAVESAVYAVGTTFSSAFFSASIIVTNMLLPKVVRMVEEGATGSEYTKFTTKVARVQAFIILYMYVAFVVYGKEFISLWMGEGYGEAWTTAILVMSGTLFSSFVITVQVILRALKKQKVYNTVHLIIFTLNAILTYYAVVIWGINGAAFMTFLTYFIGYFFIMYPYYQKVIKVNIFKVFQGLLLDIIPMSIVVGIIAWLVNKNTKQSWLLFLLEAVGYTVLYIFGAYIVMNDDEKRVIIKFLKKNK